MKETKELKTKERKTQGLGTEEKRDNIMGTRSIMPLLFSMSVPPMISMMIQSLYNIVDSIFVARLSKEALTAVSLAYPLQNLILAVAVGFGIGINACMARSLGAKKQEETDAIAAHGAVCTLFHWLMFLFIGIFLTKPFLRIFTEEGQVFTMGCSYTYIVVCCSFGTLFHILIEKMFQSVGNMVIPMLLQGIGALANIILDPIMIYGLFGFPAMGVTGAAIATVASQILACILSIILFYKKGKDIHLSLSGFKFQRETAAKIYSIAVPSGIMTALPSLLVGALNSVLVALSPVAVAVFGLYYKMQTFVYMPANGIIQGMRPIISYNYGAGRLDRMKETVKAAMLFTTVIMAAGTLLFTAFPHQIMTMFQADSSMREMGVAALRTISMGFVVSSVGIVFAGVFESVGKGTYSLAVSLVRQLLIILPFAAVVSKTAGAKGVWFGFPLAEALAAVLALFLYKALIKKIVPSVSREL